MKKLFLTYFFCQCILLTWGQNNQFSGVVLFQSSGKKPAVKVGVRDKQKEANTFYSTETGKFNLIYPNKKPGDKIELQIDSSDGNNTPIEVVNDKELKNYISSDPNEVHEIIVCKKGGRDIAAMRYYKIIKASNEDEITRLKKEVIKFKGNSNILSQTVVNLNAKIEKLETQNDSIEIYKQAFRIASINRDGANERVITYINLLNQGKLVQEAIKTLDANLASKQIKSSVISFKSGIEELKTLAEGAILLLDYKTAINCYKAIIDNVEELGAAEKYGDIYVEYVYSFFNNNQIYIADSVSIKLLSWIKKYGDYEGSKETVIYGYETLGILNRSMGEKNNLNRALIYFKKGLEIAALTNDTLHTIEIGNEIGLLFKDLGSIDSAKKYFDYTIQLMGVSKKYIIPDLFVTTLCNLGSLLSMYLNDDTMALTYFRYAIEDVQKFKLDSITLARVYNGIALVFQNLEQNDSAQHYSQKAVSIAKSQNSLSALSEYLNNYGLSINKTNPKNAIKCLRESLEIDKQIYKPRHSWIGTTEFNLGTAYLLWERNLDSAFKYKELAMINREFNFIEGNPEYDNAVLDLWYVVWLLINSGEKTNSVKSSYYENMIKIDKKYIYWRGMVFININQYKPALADFNSSLNYTSHNFQVKKDLFNSIGLCHYNLRNYDSAIANYAKAYAYNPKIDLKKLLNNLGCAQIKGRYFKEAKITLEKYESLDTTNHRAFRNWAMYYALQNDKENFFTNLQKAIDFGFKDYEWLINDDSLEAFRNEKRYKILAEQIKPR